MLLFVRCDRCDARESAPRIWARGWLIYQDGENLRYRCPECREPPRSVTVAGGES